MITHTESKISKKKIPPFPNLDMIWCKLMKPYVYWHNYTQYIPRITHIVLVLLCFVLTCFYPYSSGLLHWHWGNHMIAPVPVKQPWRIRVNISLHPLRKDYIIKTNKAQQTISIFHGKYCQWIDTSSYIQTTVSSLFILVCCYLQEWKKKYNQNKMKWSALAIFVFTDFWLPVLQ